MDDLDARYKAGYSLAICEAGNVCNKALSEYYHDALEKDDRGIFSVGMRDGFCLALERIKAALLILETEKERDWGEIK